MVEDPKPVVLKPPADTNKRRHVFFTKTKAFEAYQTKTLGLASLTMKNSILVAHVVASIDRIQPEIGYQCQQFKVKILWFDFAERN